MTEGAEAEPFSQRTWPDRRRRVTAGPPMIRRTIDASRSPRMARAAESCADKSVRQGNTAPRYRRQRTAGFARAFVNVRLRNSRELGRERADRASNVRL